jgi:site-specific DNA recombinase
MSIMTTTVGLYASVSSQKQAQADTIDSYAYYQCIGGDAYSFGGQPICHNLCLRTDTLETAVWEEIIQLLQQPERLVAEFERRLAELGTNAYKPIAQSLEKQKAKLQRGIACLIDSYAQETIEQAEFEPRIKALRDCLKLLDQEQQKLISQRQLKTELISAIANLEQFSSQVTAKLDSLDWPGKGDIIRTLVKRIEINQEDVNIVFRINNLIAPEDDGKCLQHCWRSKRPTLRHPSFRLMKCLFVYITCC